MEPVGAAHLEGAFARERAAGGLAVADDAVKEGAGVPGPMTFLSVFGHGVGHAEVVPAADDVHGARAVDVGPGNHDSDVGLRLWRGEGDSQSKGDQSGVQRVRWWEGHVEGTAESRIRGRHKERGEEGKEGENVGGVAW